MYKAGPGLIQGEVDVSVIMLILMMMFLDVCDMDVLEVMW